MHKTDGVASKCKQGDLVHRNLLCRYLPGEDGSWRALTSSGLHPAKKLFRSESRVLAGHTAFRDITGHVEEFAFIVARRACFRRVCACFRVERVAAIRTFPGILVHDSPLFSFLSGLFSPFGGTRFHEKLHVIEHVLNIFG